MPINWSIMFCKVQHAPKFNAGVGNHKKYTVVSRDLHCPWDVWMLIYIKDPPHLKP